MHEFRVISDLGVDSAMGDNRMLWPLGTARGTGVKGGVVCGVVVPGVCAVGGRACDRDDGLCKRWCFAWVRGPVA